MPSPPFRSNKYFRQPNPYVGGEGTEWITMTKERRPRLMCGPATRHGLRLLSEIDPSQLPLAKIDCDGTTEHCARFDESERASVVGVAAVVPHHE